MSIVFSKKLYRNDAERRVMNKQWAELQQFKNSGRASVESLLAMSVNHDVRVNQGLTPADAYREFDRQTKIEQVPAGEFATLTRAMNVSRAVNIGREVF